MVSGLEQEICELRSNFIQDCDIHFHTNTPGASMNPSHLPQLQLQASRLDSLAIFGNKYRTTTLNSKSYVAMVGHIHEL